MMMSQKSSHKKLRNGFMCHSRASTAVCMSTRDPRSIVVVPKRHDRTIFVDDDHTRLINYANKYSKLVQSRSRSISSNRESVSRVPKIKQRNLDQVEEENEPPKELQKTPTDNVFQVRFAYTFSFTR